jgi:ParB family chromosome partitioning protein
MTAVSDEGDEKFPSPKMHSYYVELEQALHDRLHRKVKVQYGKSKGTLTLEFYDDDDLKELANLLSPDEI